MAKPVWWIESDTSILWLYIAPFIFPVIMCNTLVLSLFMVDMMFLGSYTHLYWLLPKSAILFHLSRVSYSKINMMCLYAFWRASPCCWAVLGSQNFSFFFFSRRVLHGMYLGMTAVQSIVYSSFCLCVMLKTKLINLT